MWIKGSIPLRILDKNQPGVKPCLWSFIVSRPVFSLIWSQFIRFSALSLLKIARSRRVMATTGNGE